MPNTMGKESPHKHTNNNGSRLVKMALSENIIICGSKVPHKNIHKGTWRTPNGKVVNQIDQF